jgi:hypothetical protein
MQSRVEDMRLATQITEVKELFWPTALRCRYKRKEMPVSFHPLSRKLFRFEPILLCRYLDSASPLPSKRHDYPPVPARRDRFGIVLAWPGESDIHPNLGNDTASREAFAVGERVDSGRHRSFRIRRGSYQGTRRRVLDHPRSDTQIPECRSTSYILVGS